MTTLPASNPMLPAAPEEPSLLGAAVRSEWVGSWASNQLDRMLTPPDPNFKLTPEVIKELGQGLPHEYWGEFSGAASMEEANLVRSQTLGLMASRKKLEEAGWVGTAARLGANLVDPVGLAVGAVTGGLGWASKGTRLSRFVKAGLLADAATVPLHAYIASQDPDQDWKDVLYGAAGSFVLGGAGNELGLAVRKWATKVQKGIEFEDVKFLPDGSFTFKGQKFLAGQIDAVGPAGSGKKFMEAIDGSVSDSDSLGIVGPNRTRVHAEMADAFGPKAGEIAPVVDAYAKGWARAQGKTVDDYYAGLRVEKGGTPGEGALFSTMAWHGSPHQFDKFDISKIGTGEGAQAYGHGLYFAGSENVAKWYRDNLSDGLRMHVAGEPVPTAFWDPLSKVAHTLNYEASRWTKILGDKEKGVARAIKDYKDSLSESIHSGHHSKGRVAAWQSQLLALDLAERKGLDFKGGGRLFKVELVPDQHQYLDWDKPLSQQSPEVIAALEKMHGGEQFGGFHPFDRGSSVYKSISEARGEPNPSVVQWGPDRNSPNDAAASKALKEAGIPGIKYLDGSSRAKGEGTHNYVIFDDKDVKIKEMFQAGTSGAAQGSHEMAASGQRIIRALSNPDASTLPHEVAHDFLHNLPGMDPDLAEKAAKALGAESHAKMSVSHHEKFARGFEAYLRDGEAPTEALKATFQKFKEWLSDLYRSIVGTPLEGKMNPELRAVFDDMLSRGERPRSLPVGADEMASAKIAAGRGELVLAEPPDPNIVAPPTTVPVPAGHVHAAPPATSIAPNPPINVPGGGAGGGGGAPPGGGGPAPALPPPAGPLSTAVRTAQDFVARVTDSFSAYGRVRWGMSGRLGQSEIPTMRKAASVYVQDALIRKGGEAAPEAASMWKGRQFRRFVSTLEKETQQHVNAFLERTGASVLNRFQKTEEFHKAVSWALQGAPASVTGPEVQAVANIHRKLYREILDMGKRHGIPGFENIPADPNYFPHHWNVGNVNAKVQEWGFDKVADLYRQGMIAGGWDPAVAQQVAPGFLHGIMSLGSFSDLEKSRMFTGDIQTLRDVFTRFVPTATPDQINRLAEYLSAGAGENPRAMRRVDLKTTVRISRAGANGAQEDLWLHSLLETNAQAVFHKYASQVSGAAAEAEILRAMSLDVDPTGATNFRTFESLRAHIDNEYRMKGTLTDRGRGRADMQRLEAVRKALVGIPITQPDTFSDIAKLVRSYNFLRIGPGFGPAQLPEFGNIIGEFGLPAIVRQWPAVRQVFSRLQNGRLENETLDELENMIAAGTDRLTHQVTARFDDQLGFDEFGGSWLEKAAKRGERMVGDASGVVHITMAQQRMTAAAASQKMLTLMYGNRPPSAKRLASLGLSLQDWNNIAAQVKTHSITEVGLLGRRLRRWNIDAWSATPQGMEAAGKLITTLDRWSRQVIQDSDLGAMSLWMTKPTGRIITQFRTFTLNAWEKGFLRRVQLRDRQAFTTWAFTGVLGGLLYAGQQYVGAIGNKDRAARLDKVLDPTNVALQGFARSGAASIIPSAIDTGLWFAGADPLFNSRYSGLNSRGLTSNPTGDLLDSAASFGKGLVGAATGQGMTQSEARAGEKLLPFQTFMGVRNMLDAITDDMPKSRTSGGW